MFNNSVTLSGHLGANPEARSTTAGQGLATARLAVTRSYKDAHGNYIDDTQWFRVTGWGRTGDQMLQQLVKGDRVMFTGTLSCRTYETKTGEKRESVEVIVSSFEKLQRYSERKALVELIADGAQEGVEADELEAAMPF